MLSVSFLLNNGESYFQDRVDFIQLMLEADFDSSKSEYIHNDTNIAEVSNGHSKQQNGHSVAQQNGNSMYLPYMYLKHEKFLFYFK